MPDLIPVHVACQRLAGATRYTRIEVIQTVLRFNCQNDARNRMRTPCLLFFLIMAPAFGQDVSLTGRVTDPSGAVVAAAVVTLQD